MHSLLLLSLVLVVLVVLVVSQHQAQSMAMPIMATASTRSLMLQGKRVLVTGGGRGIGRAIALVCHQQGADVAIASRSKSELEETLRLANDNENNDDDDNVCKSGAAVGAMTVHVADVTNQGHVDQMVQEIVDIHGGLDILINNAGGAQQPKGPMDTLDAQDLNQLLQLNVVGAHIVTSSVVSKAMMKVQSDDGDGGGSGTSTSTRTILNISSKAGKVGLPNYSFYVASKFALEGMTSSWAKELKDRNIVVCSLSPGMVDTKSFPKPAGKPGVRTPESIEDAVLLALTADMEYTGHYVHADELDLVRKKGLPDEQAWKPIDERPFQV